MTRLHGLHRLAMLSAFMALFTGCGSLHEDYVASDRETYIYAQPKLEEWAKQKNDPEWEEIVRIKGIAWEVKITRAEENLKKDKGE